MINFSLANIASIFTISAFYLAWSAFLIERSESIRKKKQAKKDVISSLEVQLSLMNTWLGGSYDDSNYHILQEPHHTFHMIYGVETNSLKAILSSPTFSLLSGFLQESLVVLNQKLSGFQQHIDRLASFNTADPVLSTTAFYYYDSTFAKYSLQQKWKMFDTLAKKLTTQRKLKPEEIYLVGSVRLLKDLHVFGIGSENDPRSLRYSYTVAASVLLDEKGKIDSEPQFRLHMLIVIFSGIIYGTLLALPLLWLMQFFCILPV